MTNTDTFDLVKVQFLRFAAAGALGTALHYAVLVVLVSVLEWNPGAGAVAGATCGAAVNYWFNYRYTFRSNRSHVEALPRFFLMAGVGIALNGLLVTFFTHNGFNYLLSQAVATAMILFMNFLLSKLWIFKTNR